VLARAQQDAVWDRQQAANKLRSLLREYYPTLLAVFQDLTSSDARTTRGLAPTPAAATRCAARGCARRWPGPDAAATSTTRSSGSWPGYGPSSSANPS
jgi:hypothetical protein